MINDLINDRGLNNNNKYMVTRMSMKCEKFFSFQKLMIFSWDRCI